MLKWFRSMKDAFGASFLWLVSFIYFTQGFRSFVWTAVSYQLKDILKLSPSSSQFVVSAAFFPWSIKPVYGILSDCIPIKGRKRVPYLIIATTLSLFAWIALGFSSTLRDSHIWLTILLCLQNFGSAMADVVIDAMIAESVRLQRASFAGDLQSLSWSAMATGGILGSLLGGIALSNIEIKGIFLIYSALPMIQLLSCAFVSEFFSTGGERDIKEKDDNASNGASPVELRKAYQRKGKGKKVVSTEMDNIKVKDYSNWFVSLKSTAVSLFDSFKRPIVHRPMTWFFFSHITIPNLSTAMFYYQTETLKLDPSFLGTARVVGWCGLMLGTFLYNRFLKNLKLRIILLWAHIGLSLLILFDIVLVSRLHLNFGISDKVMVIFGSALSDAVNQFKMMPFLIISGQLCPPGIEGTLFALFMSINNLGSTIGSFFGASLASALNISSDNFDHLMIGIIIQLVATFIPIFSLFLIPESATGSSV